MKKLIIYFLLCSVACTSPHKIIKVEKQQYSFVSDHAATDTSIKQAIAPYKKEVDEQLGAVLGTTAKALSKGTPEGLLGNFIADLSLEESKKNYFPADNMNIDFCFLNNGGIRAELPQGDITKRNIFEVMPFENELIVLTLKGTLVSMLLDRIAAKGGMPVSGLRFTIKEKKPQNVMINKEPFDSSKIYKVVTSDYLANGGDELSFFSEAEKKETIGLKIRDAMIQHCLKLKADEKIINPSLDKRISND